MSERAVINKNHVTEPNSESDDGAILGMELAKEGLNVQNRFL